MYDNTFEKDPGTIETTGERSVPPSEDFAKSFAENGVPEFSGEQFGTAHEGNEFYGEAASDDEAEGGYNESIADAASLMNYGLDAAAREKGVEVVVQGIKSFDARNSENPLKDLYTHLGFNSAEEFKETQDKSAATEAIRNNFYSEYNAPKTRNKSREKMLKAIDDLKELISEVEEADPRYEDLRIAARASQKGYFEYAVQNCRTRGLAELFSELAKQKEVSEEGNKDTDKESSEDNDKEDDEKNDNKKENQEEGVKSEENQEDNQEEKDDTPNEDEEDQDLATSQGPDNHTPPAKLKLFML